MPHIQRLDVLRAIAIIMVVLFHFSILIRANPAVGLSPRALEQGQAVFDWGRAGVPLFFVISGFCIHLSFARTGRFGTADFYWRRFARIYPAYVVSLVVFTLLGIFKIAGTVNFKQFILHFFLIHNFFPRAVYQGINAAYWSLAVEFQFYLLYPLLLVFRRKYGLKPCLVVVILASLGYKALCLRFPVIPATVSNPTLVPTWCGWILGACLAEAHVEGKAFFPWKAWSVAAALFFLALCHSVEVLGLFEQLALYLFFGAILENYLALSRPLFWLERALVPVGLVSYSLYLWHMPLLKGIDYGLIAIFHVPATFFWQIAFYLPVLGLCLAPVAFASYVLLELRATEWVRRLRRSRGQKLRDPSPP